MNRTQLLGSGTASSLPALHHDAAAQNASPDDLTSQNGAIELERAGIEAYIDGVLGTSTDPTGFVV